MSPTASPELVIDLGSPVQEFPQDLLVEVVFTSPVAERTITYIGKVAAGPAQKAEMSEICYKYGEERLLPFAQTYTIKTISKFAREIIGTADGGQTITETELAPTDLIFDPNSPHYVPRALAATVPAPR